MSEKNYRLYCTLTPYQALGCRMDKNGIIIDHKYTNPDKDPKYTIDELHEIDPLNIATCWEVFAYDDNENKIYIQRRNPKTQRTEYLMKDYKPINYKGCMLDFMDYLACNPTIIQDFSKKTGWSTLKTNECLDYLLNRQLGGTNE